MPLPPMHPIADIWPLMNDEELVDLAADIQERGQLVPIVFVDDLLLDGRNRWLACEAAGVEPRIEKVETDDPDALAWSLNEHRRHASIGVRQMAGARYATMRRGDNQHSPVGLSSQADAAQKADVSLTSLKRAKTVLNHGDPEIIVAVENGDLSVSAAEKTVRGIQENGPPTYEWTPDQLDRKKRAEAGECVVASKRGYSDEALLQWAEEEGRLVRVDRRSEFGNPFTIPDDGDRGEVIGKFEKFYWPHKPVLLAKVNEWRGMVLVCWCHPEPCHADVIADTANAVLRGEGTAQEIADQLAEFDG